MAKRVVKKTAKPSPKRKSQAKTPNKAEKTPEKKPEKKRRKRAVVESSLDVAETVESVDTPETPVYNGTLIARRIWHCLNLQHGCNGMSPFLGWDQLMDKPTCPNCGGPMRWHQWGERVKEKV